MPKSADLRLVRKSLPCQVKALGDGGTFVLYAATFGNVDRQGEVCSTPFGINEVGTVD